MTDRTCTVDDCHLPAVARTVCGKHYMQLKRLSALPGLTRPSRVGSCKVEDCERPILARGWCQTHYKRWVKNGNVEFASRHPWAKAPDGTKWCSKCVSYKPTAEFYISKSTPSGLNGWCKRCLAQTAKLRGTSAAGSRRRRARKKSRRTEPYLAIEIADRDGWKCQICGRRIGFTLRWPHRRSLSIDHIIPHSKGGDDVKANVQAAHLVCNERKHTGGTDQLRLIG